MERYYFRTPTARAIQYDGTNGREVLAGGNLWGYVSDDDGVLTQLGPTIMYRAEPVEVGTWFVWYRHFEDVERTATLSDSGFKYWFGEVVERGSNG